MNCMNTDFREAEEPCGTASEKKIGISKTGTSTWRKGPAIKALVARPLVRLAIDSVRTIFHFGAKLFRRPFIRQFTFDGKQYHYFYSRHNFTYRNERIVEIPLGLSMFNSVRPDAVLEIGNVLTQYDPVPHDVVDKYEIAPGVINKDVEMFDTDKRYQLILSISTLEHVGWDGPEEKDPEKIPRSIANLKRLLARGGVLFLTIPLGHNEFLDELFKTGKLPIDGFFLKRLSWTNAWKQVAYEEVKGIRYDSPFPAANALFVGKYRKPDREL